MGSINQTLIVAVIVLVVGIILHIVAMATPAWSSVSSFDVGPFRQCYDLGVGEECTDTESGGGAVDAVKAMTILGCLLAAGAAGATVIMLVQSFLDKPIIKMLHVAAVALGSLSFVFILIGAIVWAAEVDGNGNLGYSFALTIVGGAFILSGGITAYSGGKKITPQ